MLPETRLQLAAPAVSFRIFRLLLCAARHTIECQRLCGFVYEEALGLLGPGDREAGQSGNPHGATVRRELL